MYVKIISNPVGSIRTVRSCGTPIGDYLRKPRNGLCSGLRKGNADFRKRRRSPRRRDRPRIARIFALG